MDPEDVVIAPDFFYVLLVFVLYFILLNLAIECLTHKSSPIQIWLSVERVKRQELLFPPDTSSEASSKILIQNPTSPVERSVKFDKPNSKIRETSNSEDPESNAFQKRSPFSSLIQSTQYSRQTQLRSGPVPQEDIPSDEESEPIQTSKRTQSPSKSAPVPKEPQKPSHKPPKKKPSSQEKEPKKAAETDDDSNSTQPVSAAERAMKILFKPPNKHYYQDVNQNRPTDPKLSFTQKKAPPKSDNAQKTLVQLFQKTTDESSVPKKRDITLPKPLNRSQSSENTQDSTNSPQKNSTRYFT